MYELSVCAVRRSIAIRVLAGPVPLIPTHLINAIVCPTRKLQNLKRKIKEILQNLHKITMPKPRPAFIIQI
jgi:hypothetical protein